VRSSDCGSTYGGSDKMGVEVIAVVLLVVAIKWA